MKRGLFFFYGVFILVAILLMHFIMAVAAPNTRTFQQNTTANYDKEGIFTVNWTNISGSNLGHNLYIQFGNGTVFQNKINTSNFSFSNTVNSNYTFIVEAVNFTDSTRANASLIYMVVDTINPLISYNSNTETNNSAANQNFIFVNVTATDTNTVSSNLTFSLHNGTSGSLLRQNRTSYASITVNNTFNWTSLAEGKYLFNVTANDSATNSNLTETRTFYLDATKPTITFQDYTNATIKTSTGSLTLNIFVNDSLSGLTGASCLVDVNGTNQTITLSSGWCNGTVALTGLSDGNQTILVYANDTANNFGLNNSFVVFMDSANPTATASCSPTTIYEGDPFPCTCSGTDVLTSVTTSESSTGSLTNTLATGSFTYTCSATDIAGNTASEAKTYTINRGGGGGGTTTPNLPEEIHSWTKMTPGVVNIMKDFNPEIGVKEIQITVNNEAQNVQITVTKYDGKPAEVS
ncbi:MAG: hypothetical protein Q8P79_01105, partial [Nanoarchaeota archaeon]|nr:hypothetical protein [Nanoarchaeota archaeon]